MAVAAAEAAGRQYSESGIRGRKIEANAVEGGRGEWKQRAMEGLRGGVVCRASPAIHRCVLIPPNRPVLSGL